MEDRATASQRLGHENLFLSEPYEDFTVLLEDVAAVSLAMLLTLCA
jgi:hypothetical protein